jgi:hypothetical protein
MQSLLGGSAGNSANSKITQEAIFEASGGATLRLISKLCMGGSSSNSSERGDQERRRKFLRYRVSLPVTATVLRSGGYVTIEGRSTELAEGGLGLMLSADIASGEIVDLQLWIPSLKEPLTLRAVVRRRDRLAYGLEFVSILAEQREAIRGCCDGRPPA